MGRKKWKKKLIAVIMAAAVAVTALPVPGWQADMDSVEAAVTGSLRRVSVHDPSIVKDTDGTYYVFGSHIASAKSNDLTSWTQITRDYDDTVSNRLFGDLSSNLKEAFAWAGENDVDSASGAGFSVWAPDVIYNKDYVNEDGSKGAYMIYFCTSSTYCRSVIAYAVSDRIDGGYTFKGTLVYSGFTKESSKDGGSNIDKIWTDTNIDELMEEGRIDEGYNTEWGTGSSYNTDYAPNAIDPTIFTDENGKMWMTYGSWSGGIYLLEIDPATGDVIYPKSNGKTEDGRVIDKYFGYRIAGGHTISGEGPYIVYDKESGYYYLYVTYEGLCASEGYNMRLFRATDPTGPYVDEKGNSAVLDRAMDHSDIGIKVMGNYKFSSLSNGYRAPGHNSMLIDEDGQRYLIYHTRFADNEYYHEVRVHQQFINEQGWPVTAVFENRGDAISPEGYDSSEIVGTYEFINHGLQADGSSVKSPETVYLLADGTIYGDERGTWTQKDGSYYAALVIDGVTYSGVFFKQHDESADAKEVMTFTAIGTDNQTIWGVRTSSGIEEKTIGGTAATDFANITVQPVVSYTFDDASGMELAGEAYVENGVLRFATSSSSFSTTYAKIASLTDYDFSKGVTLTADIAVTNYASDWTPLFMLGDGRVGSSGTYAYHFTQGFSSIAESVNAGQVGYYGVDISEPYKWDYFSEESSRYQWYTVTVTITDSGMATYINGTKVQTGAGDYSAIMSVFANASNNYLGASYYSQDPDFAGYMDNVAIYNQVLTDEEIALLAGIKGSVQDKEDQTTQQTGTNGGATANNTNTTNTANNTADTAAPKIKAPAKGTKLKDSKTGATYKVTKAGVSGGTVAYVSPKNKKVTSVTVPATVKLNGITYKVTSISGNAWKGCSKLKTVKIGKNVTSIGAKAFYKCTALTKLTIPSKVKKIGKQAFYGDRKLKSITIRTKKLTKSKVGSKAFKGIHAKAVIKVPKTKKSAYTKILKAKGVTGKKQIIK